MLNNNSALNEMRVATLIILMLSTVNAYSQNWDSIPGFELNFYGGDMWADTANNKLYTVGYFGLNGSDTVRGVAEFDGSITSSLAQGVNYPYGGQWCGATIEAVIGFQNKIYIGNGASFMLNNYWTNGTGVWDGIEWDTLAGGVKDNIGDIGVISDFDVIDGELYVAGAFSFAGPNQISANSIVKYDGSSWSSVYDFPIWTAGATNVVRAFTKYNNEIYVGGVFLDTAPFDTMYNICKYNGTGWVQLGNGIGGFNSWIEDMVVYNDKLYVAGSFNKEDNPSNPGNRLAVWNGSAWEQTANFYGATVFSQDAEINDLCIYDGKLFALGLFTNVDGLPASNVASFDGTTWCTYPDIFEGSIEKGESYNNELYITGPFFSISGSPIDNYAKFSTNPITLSCSSIGLNELQFSNKEIIRTIDLMGRETTSNFNNVLINIYSDGTTEKVFRVH